MAELKTISQQDIRKMANDASTSQIEIMTHLLEQNIWPERLARQANILSNRDQQKLLKSKFFIAGAGGLGGDVCERLARLGAGHLRICDKDYFEESNLNRQRFCTEKTLGQSKAAVARKGVLEIASWLDVEIFELEMTPQNLPGLIYDYDLVFDCLDSLGAKKMLEEAAYNCGKTYVHGAVLGQECFIFLNKPGQKRMDFLYPDLDYLHDDHKDPAPHVLTSTVSGTAAMMVALMINNYLHTPINSSPLIHHDFGIPALEIF